MYYLETKLDAAGWFPMQLNLPGRRPIGLLKPWYTMNDNGVLRTIWRWPWYVDYRLPRMFSRRRCKVHNTYLYGDATGFNKKWKAVLALWYVRYCTRHWKVYEGNVIINFWERK